VVSVAAVLLSHRKSAEADDGDSRRYQNCRQSNDTGEAEHDQPDSRNQCLQADARRQGKQHGRHQQERDYPEAPADGGCHDERKHAGYTNPRIEGLQHSAVGNQLF
jgi:hypothetical protein